MTSGSHTQRLLACLEAFAHQEDGAFRRDDWPALAEILQRELAVVHGLVDAQSSEQPNDALSVRVDQVQLRLHRLEREIVQAKRRHQAELAELNATARRLRTIGSSYARPIDSGLGLTHDAAA